MKQSFAKKRPKNDGFQLRKKQRFNKTEHKLSFFTNTLIILEYFLSDKSNKYFSVRHNILLLKRANSDF